MNLVALLRDNIKQFVPYQSARTEYTEAKGLLLDANENALGSVLDKKFNRYPDPLQKKLRKKIAKTKGIAVSQIFLGNGSDEAIDLLIRAFCEPGRDKIMICPPTYGVYSVFAKLNDVNDIEIPLTSQFQLNLKSISNHLDTNVKLIFLCSPNNPTGNLLNKEDIKSVLDTFKGLVVMDEAYLDFAFDKGWIDQLQNYPNLVILQTFSKAWGLANLRLGMALAQPDIISILDRIKYPYNLNGLTQTKVLKALKLQKKKDEMVRKILKQRRFLEEELANLKLVEKIYASDSNFLLVKFKDAKYVFKKLLDKKIILRDRSKLPHCDNCLRITVGTKKENNKLIKTLKKLEKNDQSFIY